MLSLLLNNTRQQKSSPKSTFKHCSALKHKCWIVLDHKTTHHDKKADLESKIRDKHKTKITREKSPKNSTQLC